MARRSSGWASEDRVRNFNHHEVVDRSCTTATCEQARRAVLLGLYDLFAGAGERRSALWVNDCDQDVCLATWILMNPDRAHEPLVRVLSQVEDLLDSSAGTFPMPHDRDLLGGIRWMFEPYGRARPHLTGMGGEPMRQVILDVHLRIESILVGRAGHLPLSGTYTAIGGGEGWLFVEVQRDERPRAHHRGRGTRGLELTARVGGRFAYSVWRRSEYVAGSRSPTSSPR